MVKKIALLIFIFLLSKISNAEITPGSLLSYEHLSANSYLIKVIIYRDCSTISAPATVKVCFSSDSCGVQDSILLPVSISGIQLPPFNLLPPTVSSCNGGSDFGVEKWTYTDTLHLPFQCSDWFLSYTNPEILNPFPSIYYPSFYNSTRINNLNFQNNSSIEINVDPTFQYCVAQTGTINFGATDIDGDSLVYVLDSVKLDNAQCPLISTLSIFPNPLDYLNAIYPFAVVNLDSISGVFSFYPTIIMAGMVSVSIYEYRNGEKINSSLVQQQVYVVSGCINTALNEHPESNFLLSPNPVNNLLKINLKNMEGPISIVISNVTGQYIKNQHIQHRSNTSYSVDVTDLQSGVYIITITGPQSTSSERFIKL